MNTLQKFLLVTVVIVGISHHTIRPFDEKNAQSIIQLDDAFLQNALVEIYNVLIEDETVKKEIQSRDFFSVIQRMIACQPVTSEELSTTSQQLFMMTKRACLGCPSTLQRILTKLCMISEGIDNTNSGNFLQEQCDNFFQLWSTLESIKTFTIEEQFNETFIAIAAASESSLTLTCLSTPIFGATTITGPGPYCLVQDITGPLVIDANAVFLDLNNHTISGAVSNIAITSHANIRISNGTLEGATNGLLISTCTNIRVTGVNFVDNVNGIFASTTTCITVKNCNFTGQITAPINFNNVSASEISTSKFILNTGTSIITLLNSDSIKLLDLTISNNSSSGALTLIDSDGTFPARMLRCLLSENSALGAFVGIDLTANATAWLIAQTQILKNTSAGSFTGINFNNTSDCVVEYCTIEENTGSTACTGFSDVGGDCTIIENSIIADNVSTTSTSIGVSFNGTNVGVILNNLIKRNTGSLGMGINLTSPFDCQIQNNIVQGNSGGASVGINHTGTLSSVIFGNDVSGQATAFNITTIPLVNFTKSTGLFTSTITTSTRELDNVNIS